MIETPAIGVKRQSKRSVSPRLLLALSLAALALAVVASLTLLARPKGQVRRLPDGTHVTLQSVTYGSEHSFDPRPWWGRLLNRPTVILNNPPITRPTVVLPPGSVVFWADHVIARRGTIAASGYGVVTDTHGCWFELTTEQGLPMFQPGGMARRFGSGFTAFPRREPVLNFGLYDSYGHGPNASFRVANPGFQAYPNWNEAPRTPITVRSGGLEFALQQLVHRNVNLRRRESAVFRVSQNGRMLPEWQARLITVRDATGNAAVSKIDGMHRLKDGSVRFSGLCRWEPAWKLEVMFERTASRQVVEARPVEFLVRP